MICYRIDGGGERMDIACLKLTQKRREYLELMNINTVEDLLNTFPYKYDIIEETYPKEDDRIIIEATVISPCQVFFKGRMSRMTFSVSDKYQDIYQVTIFNRHFLRSHLHLSSVITIIGKAQGNHITASDIKIKPFA